MNDVALFTLAEVLAVQKALANESGREPARYLAHRFIGALSEEIGALRAQGRSAQDIATLISKVTNKPVTSADVEEHYIPPEEDFYALMRTSRKKDG